MRIASLSSSTTRVEPSCTAARATACSQARSVLQRDSALAIVLQRASVGPVPAASHVIRADTFVETRNGIACGGTVRRGTAHRPIPQMSVARLQKRHHLSCSAVWAGALWLCSNVFMQRAAVGDSGDALNPKPTLSTV